MAFGSWSDFFAMGGHGFYVWMAFGVTLFCCAWLLLAPVIRHRKMLKKIARQMHIESLQEDR